MKICYVSTHFDTTDNKFLTELVARGYDVHAVSLRKKEIQKEFIFEGIKYYEYCKTQRPYGKRAKGFNPFWYVTTSKFLKSIIFKINPDILHGGYVSICGFICALTRFHPFLLMPWGSDILVEPKVSILKRQLVSYAIKQADMITCDAESVKKQIIERFNYNSDKITLFPWGIDLKLFTPSIKSLVLESLGWKDNLIVICTRMHKKIYGIEYIIDAIPDVLSKYPRARFLFIGNGPLTSLYQKRIKSLGVGGYVKFLGFISNKLLPQYLNAADVYVSPSLSDATSISLLEAMACGLPVVVTDVESNFEWIKDGYNGLLYPRKNYKVLAKKISLFLGNRELRKKMGQRNYKIAKEKASWEKNFSKLECIYQKLISKILQ